ncbi:hypothetical protein AB0B28_16585 [Glycomyces sp. NPDC046736]|uniref:hypothetical protein n=1 Tax=Glycomyces sp. NPDC046736 TaxID=3155615 RepID=UPI0033EA12D2
MFPLSLILAAAALTASAMTAMAARRDRRHARPFVLGSVALGLLGLAIAVHAYGQATMFYFMIDEQCPGRGAGEFVAFRERFLPVSGALECTGRTIQLVPAWVNPTLMPLLAAAVLAGLAAGFARRRGLRVGV